MLCVLCNHPFKPGEHFCENCGAPAPKEGPRPSTFETTAIQPAAPSTIAPIQRSPAEPGQPGGSDLFNALKAPFADPDIWTKVAIAVGIGCLNFIPLIGNLAAHFL